MSARQLTTRYEASTRVAAPVEQVWTEVGSLKQILQQIHQVTDIDQVPDGSSANITGYFSVGAIRWKLNGVAAVRSIDPQRHLEWVCDVPRYAFRIVFKVQLGKVTDEETAVRYEATGSMPRRSLLQVPVWNVLSTDLEAYVDHFLDRVQTLSEQHISARRKLGDDSTHAR